MSKQILEIIEDYEDVFGNSCEEFKKWATMLNLRGKHYNRRIGYFFNMYNSSKYSKFTPIELYDWGKQIGAQHITETLFEAHIISKREHMEFQHKFWTGCVTNEQFILDAADSTSGLNEKMMAECLFE